MVVSVFSAVERSSPGLLGLLPRADLGLLAAGAAVFGVQRLVPTYDNTFYRSLKKPSWTPPNWAFPAVWIPLKVMQSVAVWAVWRSAPSRAQLILPLGVFGAQLFLGNWWNVIFFGRRQLRGSLPWMAGFWLSVGATIATFAPISRPAAALLVPTQIWVTIAAKLNLDIVNLNRDKELSPAAASAAAAAGGASAGK